MARSDGLTEDEIDALRALQEAAPAPLAEEPIWDFLVSAGLVVIDRGVHPSQARLTPRGRAYPTTD